MTTAHAESKTPVAQAASQAITEYCDSRGVSVQIDRDRSRIHGVKILGIKSRNGRSYRPEALQAAIDLYEGAPVNVNHPKGHPGSPRDYQDRIGRIENVAYRHGEGLFGDFRFNPKHTLVEQLLWDAEHAPQNVGFSHNVQARVAKQDKTLAVEAITKVSSVDLVADPATTSGLFESAGQSNESSKSPLPQSPSADVSSLALGEATMDDLILIRPDLVKAITAKQSDELCRLQEEVDRLRATEAMLNKRAVVHSLLEEHGLPLPDSKDALDRAITSEHFVESLLTAPDEAAMRAIAEERAALAEHIHRGNEFAAVHASGAISRDPADVYSDSQSLDTASFVEAIT